MIGLALLALLSGLAIVGVLTPRDPFAIAGGALTPPSAIHFCGTDDLGRDVFTGVLGGAAVSLIVGFASAAMAVVIGTIVGGIAGAAPGVADAALMRLTEFAQALPRFFLIITLVSFFGGRLSFIVATLGLTAWPSTARMFRAQVLSLKTRDFAVASRASGASTFETLWRHIVPLTLPTLAAQVSYQAGGAILAEAGLSFLGLGDPTVMSWGAQLGAAQHFVREAWWMAVFPGIAVMLTVQACNLVADGFGRRTHGLT